MLGGSLRRRLGAAPGWRGLVTGLLLLAGVAAHAAGPPTSPALPVAIDADLSIADGRTRLSLALSRPVPIVTFLLEGPDRAVIEMPEVNFQLGPSAKRRLGIVASFRCGLAGPGRSRLVVDLAGPATVSAATVVPDPATGGALLTVEFARTDRETFRRVAAGDRADLALTTGALSSVTTTADDRPVIAIDAGHGGSDPGARAGSGLQEKDLTLRFAELLRDRLAATGRFRLVMTRESDVFVSLDGRVQAARAAGAELLISIHADTISNQQVGGATIYTGSERASDAESASLAERENAADASGHGADLPEAAAVPDILQDLTSRETRGFSQRASAVLRRDLGSVLRFSAHPQREAGFRVLRAHDLPSVLVEIGYLSNGRDLGQMSSPAWRERIAAAMAGAIDRYFAARTVRRAAMSP